jgi:5-methyltetrahydrofolate--homocysteine methyltransferase
VAARLMNDGQTMENELNEKYEHLRQDYSQEQQQLVSLEEARSQKPNYF